MNERYVVRRWDVPPKRKMSHKLSPAIQKAFPNNKKSQNDERRILCQVMLINPRFLSELLGSGKYQMKNSNRGKVAAKQKLHCISKERTLIATILTVEFT
jgi:hypothetical protein